MAAANLDEASNLALQGVQKKLASANTLKDALDTWKEAAFSELNLSLTADKTANLWTIPTVWQINQLPDAKADETPVDAIQVSEVLGRTIDAFRAADLKAAQKVAITAAFNASWPV